MWQDASFASASAPAVFFITIRTGLDMHPGSETRNSGRTVGWIIGTPYSGSSLLNLLLDGQPGVRGLGEATHFVAPQGNPYCTRCRTVVHECSLKPAIDAQQFYTSMFDQLPDCRILIDSTKAWDLTVTGHPIEPDLSYRLILLSKTPHEFTYSRAGHQADTTVSGAFKDWIGVYGPVLRLSLARDVLGPSRVTCVTYQALAQSTGETLSGLCEFLGTSFSPERHARWWESDSHIIGGNNAVFNQVADTTWFESTAPDYLQGKYEGKRHTIFRDRAWTRDAAFMADATANTRSSGRSWNLFFPASDIRRSMS